jgi:poly-beta-1,6-N-acetyl-D-glucosamine synthase
MTAAKNEAAYIAHTLDAVVNQTVLPQKWIIVDDGSTDETAGIVRNYQKKHDFISLISHHSASTRNFGAKALALRTAVGHLTGTAYDFIGNLDADVSFGERFYETLLDRFFADPALGISGGVIWEFYKKKWRYAPSRPQWCVGGATHFFRRACFEAVGSGYVPLPYGGEDTVTEYRARDLGWQVKAMSECIVYHYKPSVLISGKPWRVPYALGRQEYHWGTGVLFECAKCFFRCVKRPFAADGYARFAGYMVPFLTHKKRDVPHEIASVVRRQQYNMLGIGVMTGLLARKNENPDAGDRVKKAD